MRVTLARPEKKNAITGPMYAALASALDAAERDDDIRVLLFDAEGDAFCAGNDVSEFAAVAEGQSTGPAITAQVFLQALARAKKPYVAAVHGLAVGIGVTMLLHCDLVYVAEDAKLSTPFVNLALVPEAASTLLMPARIGYARAFELFALGEPIDGRTAARLGIANAALPTSEVAAKALSAAQALSSRPIGALKATKQLMRDASTIGALMERESKLLWDRLHTEEAREAFRAFAERRAPDFSRLRG